MYSFFGDVMKGTLYEKLKTVSLPTPVSFEIPKNSSDEITPIEPEMNSIMLRSNRSLIRLIIDEHQMKYQNCQLVEKIQQQSFSLKEFAQPVIIKVGNLAKILESRIRKYCDRIDIYDNTTRPILDTFYNEKVINVNDFFKFYQKYPNHFLHSIGIGRRTTKNDAALSLLDGKNKFLSALEYMDSCLQYAHAEIPIHYRTGPCSTVR